MPVRPNFAAVIFTAVKFRGGKDKAKETKSLRSQGGGSFAGFGGYSQCCLRLISKS